MDLAKRLKTYIKILEYYPSPVNGVFSVFLVEKDCSFQKPSGHFRENLPQAKENIPEIAENPIGGHQN